MSDELDQLILAWQAGDRSRAAELDHRLAGDPAAAALFARWCRQEVALGQVLPLASRRRAWPRLAWAASLLVAAGLAFLLLRPVPAPQPWAALEEATGAAVAGIEATAGRLLTPGEELTLAAGGRASLRLGDGSRLRLGPEAVRLGRADDGTLRLEEGSAFVEAAPQAANRPLTLQAGEVGVKVLGTAFRLGHQAGGVRLAVCEGQVALTSLGGTLVAGPGELVRVADGAAPQLGRLADEAYAFALPGDGAALLPFAHADGVPTWHFGLPEREEGYFSPATWPAVEVEFRSGSAQSFEVFLVCWRGRRPMWGGNLHRQVFPAHPGTWERQRLDLASFSLTDPVPREELRVGLWFLELRHHDSGLRLRSLRTVR